MKEMCFQQYYTCFYSNCKIPKNYEIIKDIKICNSCSKATFNFVYLIKKFRFINPSICTYTCFSGLLREKSSSMLLSMIENVSQRSLSFKTTFSHILIMTLKTCEKCTQLTTSSQFSPSHSVVNRFQDVLLHHPLRMTERRGLGSCRESFLHVSVPFATSLRYAS